MQSTKDISYDNNITVIQIPISQKQNSYYVHLSSDIQKGYFINAETGSKDVLKF